MNKSIAARTVVRKGTANTSMVSNEKRERPERPYNPSLSEQIADSDIFYKNWQFPNAREAFPNEPFMRYVDRYFPYAKNDKGELSPICFELCNSKEDVARAIRKTEAIKAAGIRYLIIEPKMEFNEAMQKLGEQ